jgi:3-dehydroquinate synthase
MKNIFKKFSVALLTTALITSCSNKLDLFPQNDFTPDKAYSSVEGYNSVLAKIYGTLSIGGNTGINCSFGKNLIGSFYSPNSVIVDRAFLKTLSTRDFNAGMAEVIKAGFIDNPKILDLADAAEKNVSELIWLSIEMKAKIVSQDFRESKIREILNYGHTLGHAIEKLENYKLRHGEAVSIGLVFAAELSNVSGHLNSATVDKHRTLLSKFGLPITYEKSALPKLLDLMASDKKSRGSSLRFIGISDVAKPIWLEQVTSEQIAAAYERISS